MRTPILMLSSFALLTAAASAQLGSVVVSTTYRPRSVHPAGNMVFCCMTDSGRQITVDATTVSAPTVASTYNPPFWDQFGDAVYTRRWGGRLIAGYRYGDVTYNDTTIPTAITTPDTEGTTYHHEGLELFTNPSDVTYLAYSEQNTSPGNAGGLRFYQVSGFGLTPTGTFLNNNEGGNAISISPAAQYLYQLGEIGGPGNVRFWVYDPDASGGFASPSRLVDIPMPGATTRYSSSQMKRNIQGNNLVVTRGWEGLTVVNTQIPTSPVFNIVLSMPGTLFFDGVRFFPNSNFAVVWGLVRIGGVDTDFLLFVDASNPGVLIPIGSMGYPMQVNDVQMQGPRIYILGTDRTTGDAVLDIW